jgi:predicted dehydrogenase
MTPSSLGPVGVGIIGAGAISSQYLQTLTECPDVRVLFVADLDAARAAERATEFGIPASGDVQELLDHPGIEIAVNLTIPAVHVEVSLRSLRAGKNVWSEKPLALDRASGAKLLTEAARRGLRVAAAPDTFLGPGIQTVRRLVDEGRIGTALSALALFQTPGPESWHPAPDFLYASGGGPLLDMGPYYATALVQVFGPVARVAASESTAFATRVIGSGPRAGESFPVSVPTHVGALIEFESGASAQAVFSFQSAQRRTGFLEIAGSSATIVAPDPNGFEGDVVIVSATDREVIPTASSSGRGVGIIDLARSIRAGVPERASGDLSYHVLDILTSIGEAAQLSDFVEVSSSVSQSAPVPPTWDPRAITLIG